MVFGNSTEFQATLAASDNRHAVTDRIQREIGFRVNEFTMVLKCARDNDPGWPERVANDLLMLMNGRGDAKCRHLTHCHVDKVELVVELIPTSSSPQSSSPANETDPLLGRPDQTGATAHAVPEQAISSTMSPLQRYASMARAHSLTCLVAIKNACCACASKLGLLFFCLVFVVLAGSVEASTCYLTSSILPRFLLKMVYVASALDQADIDIAKSDERGDRDWAKISAAGEQIVKASEAAWDALVGGFTLPLNLCRGGHDLLLDFVRSCLRNGCRPTRLLPNRSFGYHLRTATL